MSEEIIKEKGQEETKEVKKQEIKVEEAKIGGIKTEEFKATVEPMKEEVKTEVKAEVKEEPKEELKEEKKEVAKKKIGKKVKVISIRPSSLRVVDNKGNGYIVTDKSKYANVKVGDSIEI